MLGHRRAFLELALALDQPVLVLGMDRAAPLPLGQHPGEVGIFGDQQIAGRAAHEDLDPGATRHPLQLRQFVGVVRRGADEEGGVAPQPAARVAPLLCEGVGVGDQRLGVRHVEDGGDAAEGRRRGTGAQVLLMLEAGLAEVDLGVDDAGQHVQAADVEDALGFR